MEKSVREELGRQGFEEGRIKVERMLNMRFDGTDTALMVLPAEDDKDEDGGVEDFEKAFKRVYKQEFGFLLDSKNIVVDDLKVRGIGKTFDSLGPSVYEEMSSLETRSVDAKRADSTYSTYFDKIGRVEDTPVFLLDRLEKGDAVVGPAMVIDDTQTIVVVPGARAVVTSQHLYITMG